MKDLVNIRKDELERILLVVVELKKEKKTASTEEITEELTELVKACLGEVVETIICRVETPTATYLITEGKVEEIAEKVKEHHIDTVVFGHDLKGSQQRNLEERIVVKTIDRTQLILDIFARRAKSNDGKIQVELAQLQYSLPRLTGHGKEMSRLGGGIGTLGPGETKLEVDRRRISQRIDTLRKSLKDIEHSRTLNRKRRKENGIPVVSLVGYTNSGKTTLLNKLTGDNQQVEDALFTTLDPISRICMLSNRQKIIVSDTVGFMRDLPHHLIDAFKSTLEEAHEADLLLHVIDISNPNFRQLYEEVNKVLKDLNAFEKKTILVLNKIDRINDPQWLASIKDNFKNSVCISAKAGMNLEELYSMIAAVLSTMIVEINVDIPINRMDLINLAHKEGEVLSIKYYNDRINIRVSLPTKVADQFYKIGL